MANEKSNMTVCKSCGAEIAKSAKVCPHCGAKNKKPVYKRPWFIVLIAIVVIAAVASIGGGGSDDGTSSPGGSDSSTAEEQKIEYTDVTVDDLIKELGENAANASEKYKDQYLSVEGRLGNIDSDGSYISIYSQNDEWDFQGVTCYIKSDDQLTTVKELKNDDILIVKGKMTDVGEVLGYSMDIDSIEKKQ